MRAVLHWKIWVRQLEAYATDLSENYSIEDATTQKQRTIATAHYCYALRALGRGIVIYTFDSGARGKKQQLESHKVLPQTQSP